jgi:hypothetical protein
MRVLYEGKITINPIFRLGYIKQLYKIFSTSDVNQAKFIQLILNWNSCEPESETVTDLGLIRRLKLAIILCHPWVKQIIVCICSVIYSI